MMTKTNRTVRLTNEILDREPFTRGEEPATRINDSEVRGLFVLIGKRTKSIKVQCEVKDADGRRATRAKVLGQWGIEYTAMSVVRRDAMEALVAFKDSAGRGTREGMTLRAAWDLLDRTPARRGPNRGAPRAAKTLKLSAQARRYFAPWLDRPLASITAYEARKRHEDLTREIAEGKWAGDKLDVYRAWNREGKQQADDVFRIFKAVWNRAALEEPTLPRNPVDNVNMHHVEVERTALPASALAKWHAGVLAVANPVRRDYLLFTMLTGMRREAASVMRWDDVDLKAGVLHVPKPKGGKAMAFDLPLSPYLTKLLRARKDDNAALADAGIVPYEGLDWCWPAYSATGHIAEPREEIAGVPYTIHDLRRTFITQALAAGVPEYLVAALANHREPKGTMTRAYVRLDDEAKRAAMTKITARFMALWKGRPMPASATAI